MTRAIRAERIDPLRQALEALGRRRRRIGWTAALLRALRWALLGCLALVLLDAAVDLPNPARIAGGVALTVACFVVAWRSWPRRFDAQRAHLAEARRLENHFALNKNPLISALQSENADDSDALAADLAERARQRGWQASNHLDQEAVLDRSSATRQGGYLWAAVVAWGVAAAIQPALVMQGLPRWLTPGAAVAPVSLTQLDVQVTPEQPYVGEDVQVQASVAGKVPEVVEMVELDEAGRELRRWAMGEAGQGAFQRTLRELREPMTFRIEAGEARSQVFRIEPQARPTPALADEPVDPEPAADPAAERKVIDLAAYLAEHEPALHEQLQQLKAQAEVVRELSEVVTTSDPATTDPQQWMQKVATLDEQVKKFQEQAAQCAGGLREAAGRAPEPYPPPMNMLADALESLSLCEAGQCPNPGPAPGFGSGVGSGGGMGAGGMMFGEQGMWAAGIRQAVMADLDLLSPMEGELMPLGTSSPFENDATNPFRAREGAVGGAYHETLSHTGEQRVGQALMLQVPAEYRELVAAYFDQVNQPAAAQEENR